MVKKYEYESEPRTQFEPLKPSREMPRRNDWNSYLRRVNGCPVEWMCYCVGRFDWLMRTLVSLGVSVEHFHKKEGIVPQEKCQEIARALEKVRGQPRDEDDEELLEQDIKFYLHCGGLRIHDWKSTSEIGY